MRSFCKSALRTCVWLFLATIALGAAVAAASLVSTEVDFLLRSGYEEARILLARRPLRELIEDPATPAERVRQFQMVLSARAFAAKQLGLAAGDTYTTFSDVGDRDSLLWVVTASRKDRLEAYRWWYPIVGSVPYKGFFQREDALAEQRRLEAAGYDTYLRPSGAFSTLGWFNDPLLSTALEDDPVELVSTVIHELAHNTLWAPGSVRFNESYANFVGLRGAEIFFASQGDERAALRCAAMWRDEKRLGDFYESLSRRLDALYASGLAGRQLEAGRREIFSRARAYLAGPLDSRLEVYSGKGGSRRELNNAVVIAARIYRTGLDGFDRVLGSQGGDVRASVGMIQRLVEADPGRPLAALAAGPRVPARPPGRSAV